MGGRVGFKGIDAIHLRGVLKEFGESDIGVLENVSFNQLLQGQRAVVDEGGLCKLIHGGFGGFISGIAKESTQEVLEGGQKGGEVTSHTQGSEGATTITSKVVRDILFLEGGSKFLFKVAVVSKSATIEPSGRARSIQIGESMGGTIIFFHLGKSEVASNCKKPG